MDCMDIHFVIILIYYYELETSYIYSPSIERLVSYEELI